MAGINITIVFCLLSLTFQQTLEASLSSSSFFCIFSCKRLCAELLVLVSIVFKLLLAVTAVEEIVVVVVVLLDDACFDCVIVVAPDEKQVDGFGCTLGVVSDIF